MPVKLKKWEQIMKMSEKSANALKKTMKGLQGAWRTGAQDHFEKLQ